jgi:hypothetical protein
MLSGPPRYVEAVPQRVVGASTRTEPFPSFSRWSVLLALAGRQTDVININQWNSRSLAEGTRPRPQKQHAVFFCQKTCGSVIWNHRFVARSSRRHGVSTEEVEEVLFSSPHVRRVEKGRVKGEDLYAAYGRTAGTDTWWSSSSASLDPLPYRFRRVT